MGSIESEAISNDVLVLAEKPERIIRARIGSQPDPKDTFPKTFPKTEAKH